MHFSPEPASNVRVKKIITFIVENTPVLSFSPTRNLLSAKGRGSIYGSDNHIPPPGTKIIFALSVSMLFLVLTHLFDLRLPFCVHKLILLTSLCPFYLSSLLFHNFSCSHCYVFPPMASPVNSHTHRGGGKYFPKQVYTVYTSGERIPFRNCYPSL